MSASSSFWALNVSDISGLYTKSVDDVHLVPDKETGDRLQPHFLTSTPAGQRFLKRAMLVTPCRSWATFAR
jgi:hypothetical protein